MRLVRVVCIVVIIVGLVLGAVAGFALHNQARIVGYVLTQVRERTGVAITIQGSRIRFRSHLVVDLEHPRLAFDGRQASLRSLRAVISYHSLIFTRGLPLYALILNRPEVRAPSPARALRIPRPGTGLSGRLLKDLAGLAAVTRRLNIYGAVVDTAATPDTFDLVAYHRLFDWRIWYVNFDSVLNLPACPGVNLTGALTLGRQIAGHSVKRPAADFTVAQGRLWFWGASLAALTLEGVTPDGTGHGAAVFTLTHDGRLTGSFNLGASRMRLTGARFKAPLALGSLTARGAFDITQQSAALTQATLFENKTPAFSFSGRLDQPYSDAPTLTARIGGWSLQAAAVKRFVASLSKVPPAAAAVASALKSGEVEIDRAVLTGAPGGMSPAQIVGKDLTVSAGLEDAAFAAPAGSGLPDVRDLRAALSLNKGLLTVEHGAARAGKSSLDRLRGRFDLAGGFARVPYTVKAKATLDSGQIFAPLKPRLVKAAALASRINGMSGRVAVAIAARGVADAARPAMPADWSARVAPLDWALSVDSLPAPVSLIAGTITASNGGVRFDRLTASTRHGTAVVGGEIGLGARMPVLRNLSVELHGIEAARWLPLLVDPKKLAVKGAVGGSVVLNSGPDGGMPAARGKFTMGPGQIQFGFLRSPIVVLTALLDLDGRGLKLTMPGATLEGSPLLFTLAIADLKHPTMRITAKVRRLDLEVMKFVRLPWEPPTPVFIFKIPVVGHIAATTGVIEKFTMRPLKADFSYNNGDWHVYNVKAHALGGTAILDVLGRQRDDWIHIRGSVSHQSVGQLFELKDGKTPPMTGQLYASADLWADTDNDFFKTLAGRATLVIRNGRLNKFTLLSRMLGTIDIKNWLTASVPDPRIAGLPFNSLSGEFAGSGGIFYTDDLRLEGPVLDIVAQGNMNLATSDLDMQIGMLPFNTANWLVSKIPLIGKQVSAGSKGLVGAYFDVGGPYTDPDITPKPITSLFEMVKKILALPINLIQPNTVK